MQALDDVLYQSLRVARNHGLVAWRSLLLQHRQHPSFQAEQDVRSLEIGFSCSCSGEPERFMFALRELRGMVPEARRAFMGLHSHLTGKGNKARKRKARKALVRANALLYRYLTKEQKWSLRGAGYFDVKGQDGEVYRIHSHSFGNVKRLDPETQEPSHSYCVVPKHDVTKLPNPDLILAQKVLLESDLKSFMDVAVVRDLRNPVCEDLEPLLSVAGVGNQSEATRIPVASTVGGLLLHDICITGLPQYDTEDRLGLYTQNGLGGLSFVLNEALEVVPCFDIPFVLPMIPDADVDSAVLRLLTGVPVLRYATLNEVIDHFRQKDIGIGAVLLHPETPDPMLPGARIARDARVPEGEVYVLAEDHFVGMVVHAREGSDKGFCIHNLDGVVVYEHGNSQENQG